MQDVATDPGNALLGYAAVGGFSANTPTTPGHVFQITCTARCATFTWVDKSGNLPDIPANAIMVNPRIPTQVFVGMDWGLYYTDDITSATPTWQRFEGLPHVMVWSLNVDRGFTTLAAFTRSRGAWAWPLPGSGATSADLEVQIAAPPLVEPGKRLTYTITLTNHGADTAANVQLSSTSQAGTTFVANSGDCSTAFPCAFASVPSGATQTVVTSVCVPRNYAGGNPLTLTAAASSDAFDPVGTNNTPSVGVPLPTDIVFGDGFDPCP